MRATVLWTGGKDSALAFYKAGSSGCEIVNLLTFVPKNADFLAHPVPFMKRQAEAMGMAHHEEVVAPPLEDAYEKAIRSFKDRHKIDAFITGDIAEVDGQPNWIKQRSMHSNVDVIMPLWDCDRRQVFEEFLSCGFRVIISCIKKGALPEPWLGKELDEDALNGLREISGRTGLDICGEQGEYHTLVVDGPMFKKSIIIGGFSKHADSSVMYVKPHNVTLREKP